MRYSLRMEGELSGSRATGVDFLWDSGASLSGFESWIYRLVTGCVSLVQYLTFCFSFLMCQMGLIMYLAYWDC